ncbi:MAG: hypothetical protein LQ345_001283 [Seirophora villosa]|nr:MAG: hypothetical protein LQ345_001283 [Seirophora villosa]
MQLRELLQNITPRYEIEYIDAESAIKKLRETIENIPERESVVVSDAQRAFEKSSKIRIPFPRCGAAVTSKLLLKYSKPAYIGIVGSFARRTALLLDGKVSIDMAVTMPSHLYQAKDYRDYRYFQKRAYYLACLADGIQKANIPYLAVSFAYQDENEAQPILIIEPVQDQSGSFRNACMLGAIWLRQRGIGSSKVKGGFGQFEWASVMSTLMRGWGRANRRVLTTSYSSYQLFKTTLQFLASTDLIASTVVHPSTDIDFARTDQPILFDESTGLNFLFKMSPWSYKALQHEARNSLRALNDPLIDRFKALFISKVDEPSLRFDYIFSFSLKGHDKMATGGDSMLDLMADCANEVFAKFTYGLSDRTFLICPHVPSRASWQVSSMPSHLRTDLHVTVGLLLNPENSQRMVDRGPPIDDKKASALFREFWGDRAELRRFKDGTISESVLWSGSHSKHAPLDMIVRHILERHFDIHELSDVGITAKAFDSLLIQQKSTQTEILGPFTPTRTAFEALCKSIRDLEGLPLQIRQISAASPALRSSSVVAPMANKPDSLEWPVEIQIQFEGSTRWPQDLAAVQQAKIAFLHKVAEGLERGELASAVALALENSEYKLPEEPFLDVATRDGIIFRLRIYHEYELKILEQALHGQVASAASREELALAVLEHKRRYIQGPAHTQAVFALSTKFPLLSPTIRLLKKWRDAHLLSSHLRDELIELVAIRTFLHPSPWQPPGSLNSAFIRTLAFIANWDWHSDPLLVDLNSELRKPDIEDILTTFQARRKLDPGMHRAAMFAASDIDRQGIIWTHRRPVKVTASRFTKLAAAATAIIKEKGLGLEPGSLFLPSLAEYDFVVHLKHKFSKAKSTKSLFKNLEMGTVKDPLEALLKPAQGFFEELEDLYGDNVIFFYDRSAATAIAGLWNPATGPRDWKVDLGYNAMTISEVGSAEPHGTINKLAVLHDIARLGGDMVAKIDHSL